MVMSHGEVTPTTQSVANSMWVVDKSVYEVFITVTFTVCGTVICFIGTIANMINMAVFVKLGFLDTINISLFGLAVSDGVCLLTRLWVNIALTPQLEKADIQFVAGEVATVTGSIPYLCFTKISALILTYITMERCLCIVFPLNVKTILTPRRTTFCIAAIFLTMFAVTAPHFSVNLLKWDYYPKQNRTMFRNYFPENRAEVESVLYSINNFFVYTSFICITLFTSILVTSLNNTIKWRANVILNKSSAAARGRKVVRMVVTVSAVFIICFFPKTLVYFLMMINPAFDFRGAYHSIAMMVVSLAFCLETMDCSINIFIYRHMSTKYRRALDSLFASFLTSAKTRQPGRTGTAKSNREKMTKNF